jgi:hypothetical protein
MTLIVLVLLGLLVLVVTISPPERGGRKSSRDTAATAPQVPAKVPLTNPDAFDVSAKLSAAPGAAPKTVEAELGDRVQLIVDGGEEIDTVAVGDLSMEGVEPGVPARFEIFADTPGAYPIVLVDENRRIGTLEVR